MLKVENVRVHNLKEVCLEIPAGQCVLFCGLSGSGKSSLAFDTFYAEGQRRYIECLSPQTRQFITQLDKPDADKIEGIPPAIAVEAFRGRVDSKLTVGMATEVAENLRLLFTELAIARCPDCGETIRRSHPQQVAQQLIALPTGSRFQIVFEPDWQIGDWPEALATARKNGFSRAIVDRAVVDLSQTDISAAIDIEKPQQIRIVVDRLKTGGLDPVRLTESLELAFQSGGGKCEVWFQQMPETFSSEWTPRSVDWFDADWLAVAFGRQLECQRCGAALPELEPRLFRHTDPHGACSECDGSGIGNRAEGGVCPGCGGTRLNREARAFEIAVNQGDANQEAFYSYGRLGMLSVDELRQQMPRLRQTESQKVATAALVQQIRSRLDYLLQVGLGYLNLNRSVESLSAGEAQRVSLTSCLSSTLVNALYVLDEPSVGLHAVDTDRLISAIQNLNQRGNTVILVDHDEQLIRAVPRVVELGPRAGSEGGQVVFDGSPATLESNGKTVTADFLAGRRGVSFRSKQRRAPRGWLKLKGAAGHNLKNIDVDFPLGCLTVVTGVSGAGKSSLVQETLYPAICQLKRISGPAALPFQDLLGDSIVDEVVLVDRSPIGRSARSNPVTYVKAFDGIRRCFSDTVDARTRQLDLSQFSFNATGGRCDKCEGAGELSIDMQFLPEVRVTCDACQGTRYRDEVLSVKYRGKSIADVLGMTVRDAFSFFRGQPKLQTKLKALIDVGLDYICLGQPANTLSSGEAQRLKLASYLNAAKSKRALFLMDEPTTGLHMADVTRLLDCFDVLLSVGHSLIVIEHNVRLVASADWVIDLGPGPGAAGGEVVICGTPEEVAGCEGSLTGRFLTLVDPG